jgi:exopolyphosphatase / guanosine-5'-triphosphate,3'-diphosphate pyrophosphatase
LKVGVVDIGTNSMRLLITDGVADVGRWEEVTGLGRGVDTTGRLSEAAMDRTLEALSTFGALMTTLGVDRRAAMATSATRDASNRKEFCDRAEESLGVRPEVINGDREGVLSYAGATSGLDGNTWLVSDIGGGSTEFVTRDRAVSIDIGSVRLTDRLLGERPAPDDEMMRARQHVLDLFAGVSLRGDLVGVAGTWTSLAAIDRDLPAYDGEQVHHHRVTRDAVASITDQLAAMTVEQTAAIRSLDPARAPVLLAGVVVAGCVMDTVSSDTVLVSGTDSLDGLALELLAVT